MNEVFRLEAGDDAPALRGSGWWRWGDLEVLPTPGGLEARRSELALGALQCAATPGAAALSVISAGASLPGIWLPARIRSLREPA